MSSPNPSGAPAGPSKPSRPLGTAKPPAKAPSPAAQPGGGAPAQIPRRLAGTVPGIARAASNLRQSSTPNALGNPLASIPAHLRNLSASASAPRIPSPLGKGTPARTSKSNLPVRTSKTTERHVFLPEDPQLAPLPKSPMGSQMNLASMGPPRSTAGASGGMGQRERERRDQAQMHGHAGHGHAAASASASGIMIGQGQGSSDERSDAEKMTKREREEARLPRLTAYTTADSYRLKFLQAFLKREHGVGVVRVFDDCVYAVYNLPLLPGYGATTKIRSSPAIKSPGGVSLLERMTQAEDLGYDDSYFPAAEDTERDPHISADDPAEYILSHSPPSPIAHMSMQEAEERVRELREEVDHIGRGEGHGQDERQGYEAEGQGRQGRNPTSPVSPSRTIRPSAGEADGHGESRESDVQLGTHMSPTHPGYLEHVPAPALSPEDLPAPLPHHHQHHDRVVEHHQNDPAISPTRTTDSMPLSPQRERDHEERGLVTDRDIGSALQLDLARQHGDSAVGTSPTSPPSLTRSTSQPEARDTQHMHDQYRQASATIGTQSGGRHVSISSPISVPHPHPPMFARSQTVPVRERARRRKSHSTHNQVAEAVFFSYGVSVFFGFQPDEEKMVMEDIDAAGCWVRGAEEEDWEVEEFHYVYDGDAEYPRIYNDMFTFKSHSHLFKLSLAHAIAQSTKLSIYESTMQESLALTSSFPKELSMTGHLHLERKEALKITGRLWKLRMDVNLIGGILDTPELFWSEASLFPLYEAIREYLEIGPRVQVLNDRLSVAGDLLEIIHEYIEERANHRITWIIIWLIVIACVVEAGEVVARVVFHNLPRDTGELLLVKGTKAILGVSSAGSTL